MKKAIFAALVLLGVAAISLVAGRGNVVYHVDPRTGATDIILSSAGNCRHHLTAHPDDRVATADPKAPSDNPNDCH